MRREGRYLSVPAPDCARHQRDARGDGRIIDREAGREIIAAIQHQVRAFQQSGQIACIGPHGVSPDAHRRVQRLQRIARSVHLGAVNIGCPEKHLPLEIIETYRVWIDDPQRAHSGGGQIKGSRAAKPPAPMITTLAAPSRA